MFIEIELSPTNAKVFINIEAIDNIRSAKVSSGLGESAATVDRTIIQTKRSQFETAIPYEKIVNEIRRSTGVK